MIRVIHSLVLGLALLGGNEFAKAADTPPSQAHFPVVTVPGNPRVKPPAAGLRPVVLHGSENLPGMGDLYFVVSDNDVVMVDATRKPVYGAGRLQGNRISMTFGNCVYEGELVNGVFSGTARFTSGPNANRSWSFNTRVIGIL